MRRRAISGDHRMAEKATRLIADDI